MNHWQGKWALITGASAGIGTALARELAAGGTNLVLTARRRDRLAGLAAELSAKHDIRTLVCVADLAQPSGPQQIFDFTEEKKIAIDLLANNAGFGAYGEFHKITLERLIAMTQVNVTAVVHMTHLYLPGMIARGGGDILIVASLAGFLRCPTFRRMPPRNLSICILPRGWPRKSAVTAFAFARCARAPRKPNFFRLPGSATIRGARRKPPRKSPTWDLRRLRRGKAR